MDKFRAIVAILFGRGVYYNVSVKRVGDQIRFDAAKGNKIVVVGNSSLG